MADLELTPLRNEILQQITEDLRRIIEMAMQTRKEDEVFDVKGLCGYLNVSPQWVYKCISNRKIPHFKIGRGLLRFRKSLIDKWMQKHSVPEASNGHLKAIGNR